MKKVNIILFLFAMLFGAAASWFVMRPTEDPVPIVEQSHIDSIKVVAHRYDSILKEQAVLRQKIKADSLAAVRTEAVHQKEMQRLEKRIAQVRPAAQPAIDTIPEVAALVNVLDSANNTLQARVDSLQREKARAWGLFNQALTACENKNQASQEIARHYRYIADARKEDNRHVRRANKWLKVALVGTTTALTIQTLRK